MQRFADVPGPQPQGRGGHLAARSPGCKLASPSRPRHPTRQQASPGNSLETSNPHAPRQGRLPAHRTGSLEACRSVGYKPLGPGGTILGFARLRNGRAAPSSGAGEGAGARQLGAVPAALGCAACAARAARPPRTGQSARLCEGGAGFGAMPRTSPLQYLLCSQGSIYPCSQGSIYFIS